MPSGKKNAITKIELEVNGKKISLSFEEAKSLREILNDLMGEKEIRWLPGNHYHTSPWMYPYWSWTWCGGDGGGTLTLCNTGGEVGNTAMASDGTNGGR